MLVQDPAQPREVLVVELPVPRRRALGVDQPLALEEADLRDRDVGKLIAQLGQHLADREVRSGSRSVGGAHAVLTSHEEHEHETTDLEVGEGMQRRGVDAVMVDVGAVE